MKYVLICISLLLGHDSFAATKSECLDGNFAACKVILNRFGSGTDKTGAIDFFTAVCSSQKLDITCEVISTEKSETLKKSLDIADMKSALFVINGTDVDKIYKVSTKK